MSKAENRAADIRRTAEEIRLQFLNDHADAVCLIFTGCFGAPWSIQT